VRPDHFARCLLFSKILTCPQDGPAQECPALLRALLGAWPMLVFPVLWVVLGVSLGAAAARVSRAPPELHGTILAACGFANSTGLPIVPLL